MRIIKRQFALAGLVSAVGALICFSLLITGDFRMVYLLGGVALAGIAFISWVFALRRQGGQTEEDVDGRETFIIQKSGNTTLRILNNLLFIIGTVAIFGYGMTKLSALLFVGVTLFAVIIAMFIIVICADAYYEKHA